MTLERISTPLGRLYAVPGGGNLPSVTTILATLQAPGIPGWAARCAASYAVTANWADSMTERERIAEAASAPDQVRDFAADRGTRVHAAVERYVQTEEIPEDKEIAGYVKTFASTIEEYRLTPILCEVGVFTAGEVVDDVLLKGYAGTADLLVRDEQGGLFWLDLKTGKNVHANAARQTVAYGMADYFFVEGEWITNGALRVRYSNENYAVRYGVLHLRPRSRTLYEVTDPEARMREFELLQELWYTTRGEGASDVMRRIDAPNV